MTKHDDLAVAADHSVDPSRWLGLFDDLMLFATLIIQPTRNPSARHRMHWSTWRRHHQHTALTCHYQRQASDDP